MNSENFQTEMSGAAELDSDLSTSALEIREQLKCVLSDVRRDSSVCDIRFYLRSLIKDICGGYSCKEPSKLRFACFVMSEPKLCCEDSASLECFAFSFRLYMIS